MKQNGGKTYQKAFLLYVKTEGKVPLAQMMKLVEHLEKCENANCKKIIVTDGLAYIGTV